MAIKTVKIDGTKKKKTTYSLRTDVYNYAENGPSQKYDLSQGKELFNQYDSNKTTSTPKRRTTGGGGVNTLPGAGFDTETGTYVGRRTTGGGGNNKVPGSYIDRNGRYSTIENYARTVNYITPTRTDPVEKVKTDLSTFSSSLSKKAKYYKLSKNLTTLYDKTMDEGAEKQRKMSNRATTAKGLTQFFAAIGTVINPLLGAAIEGGGMLIASTIGKGANDTSYEARAEKISQLNSSIVGYMESLENRDTLMMDAMSSVTGTIGDMRLTYGDSFVDQFYNLMLAKSGMTPDTYSLLTGNFNTFENIGYGTVSGENGLFDQLTVGNSNLFNNMYAQLTREDLDGIMTSLTQALYSGNTEIGEQLRGYENDLNVLWDQFINSQGSSVDNAMYQLEAIGANARAENISAAESIGSAQAERGSSGLRGGTSTSNEALARLSADLGRMSTAAQASNIINSLRYAFRQQELQASSTAYNYASAQRRIKLGAENAMISSLSSVGRTLAEVERSANRQIIEAQEYEEQAWDKMNEFDADETEIMLNGLGF